MRPAPARCIACGDEPVVSFERDGATMVRSPGCGLEWRDPFPDEAELAALYAEPYLARWGIDGDAAFERVRAMKRDTYAPILAEIRRHAGSGRLLDVGCALGFLVELATEQGFEAYGLDRNPDAVARARERLGDRVIEGRLEEANFPGLEFDAVTLVDVFEHVPEPGALLDAVAGRLAPGGVLAAVLPNAASLMRRVLGRRWPHYAPEHLYHWSPRSLRVFLARHGFEVRSLRTGFRKSYTGDYLTAYARSIGAWLPPGVGALGTWRIRVPTGEVLLVARRRAAEATAAA